MEENEFSMTRISCITTESGMFYAVKNWSIIRQKDESQNESYKKTKHANFSEKHKFLTPVTHA